MQEIVTKKTKAHQTLFDEMMKEFNLSAKEVAEAAGISEVMLSNFRRGKADLGMTKFLDVFAVIPDEAKEWYFSRVLNLKFKPKASLRMLIDEASPQEKAEVLIAIATWAKQCPDEPLKLAAS